MNPVNFCQENLFKLFGGFLITLTYLLIMMIYLWRGGYLNKKEL